MIRYKRPYKNMNDVALIKLHDKLYDRYSQLTYKAFYSPIIISLMWIYLRLSFWIFIGFSVFYIISLLSYKSDLRLLYARKELKFRGLYDV